MPIAHRILTRSGDKVLQASIDLDPRTNRNTLVQIPFVFDSGTEMTTMPADQAGNMDLPMPRHPVRGLLLHGQEVRAGLLRARVVGLGPTEYTFPCDFLGDLNASRPDPRFLPGLTGVINQVRLILDGTYTLAAPHGRLIVETC